MRFQALGAILDWLAVQIFSWPPWTEDTDYFLRNQYNKKTFYKRSNAPYWSLIITSLIPFSTHERRGEVRGKIVLDVNVVVHVRDLCSPQSYNGK